MTVEERRLAGEFRDRLVAGELALPRRALRLQLLAEPVEEREVGVDLLLDAIGIGRVVMLEHLEERVIVDLRPRRRHRGSVTSTFFVATTSMS